MTSSVSRRGGRAVAAQQRRDVVDQRAVEQVGGRQVGGDPPRAIEAEPGPGLADRHGQHAAAELAHELGVLDGGQEGAGGQQPALGVAPAHERLDAHELAGRQVGDRLVVQRQLVVAQGVAHLAGQLEAIAAVVVALGGVDPVPGAPALGLVHRDVGVAQQGARVLGVLGEDGDADARADVQRDPGERVGAPERRAQPGGRHRGRLGVGVLDQHAELVAAQAGDDVAGAHRRAQPRADAAQQLVADVVAERVVELLELVEVDHRAARTAARRRRRPRPRRVNARRLARPVRSSVSESLRETASVAVSRSSSAMRTMTVSSASTARRDRDRVQAHALAVDEHADRDRREGRREDEAFVAWCR